MRCSSVGRTVSGWKEDVQQLGGKVSEAARERMEKVGEAASEYYRKGRERAREVGETMDAFVRRRPWETAFLALGIGAAICLLVQVNRQIARQSNHPGR